MTTLSLVLSAVLSIVASFFVLKFLFRGTKCTPQMLVRAAIVAALYTVVCLVLAPFSFGAVQVRVAEALCLLPIFGVEYIVAVTLGCFLTNLIGSTALDVVFGTLATLLACIVTYLLRKHRIKGLAILPSLPPVVFNAVIIGSMIAVFFMGDTPASTGVWLFTMFTVGIGEVISCTIIGAALVRFIEKTPSLLSLFTKE